MGSQKDLFAPTLHYSFIPVENLRENGFDFFSNDVVNILRYNVLCVTGSKITALRSQCRKKKKAELGASLKNWHERLDHANYSGILQMVANNVESNLNIGSKARPEICTTCFTAHQTVTISSKTSSIKTAAIHEIVFPDFRGPVETTSKGDRGISCLS